MRQRESTLLRPTASVSLGALLAVLLAAVGFASGGYDQSVWPWVALPLLWACILTLVRPTPLRFARSASVLLALIVAWAMWTALSLAWSIASPQTALEVERDLMYAAFLGILVLLVRTRAEATAVIAAVAASTTAVVVIALATYLLAPGRADATQGRLLFEPIGYANGFGGL